MRVVWTPNAKEDYLYWQKADQKILGWINDLIRDVQRDPFKGLGKPEPLKHGLQGCWSRRIPQEDRLVYRVSGKDASKQGEILQCRFHY